MASNHQYSSQSDTPLKYFGFLKIVLPIGLVIRIIQFVGLLASSPTWYDISFSIIDFVLTVLAIVGMNKMDWYGVLAFVGIYLLTILDAVIGVVIVILYDLSYPSIPSLIGRVFGSLVVIIPSWIYFKTRRWLFDPRPQLDNCNTTPNHPLSPSPNGVSQTSSSTVLDHITHQVPPSTSFSSFPKVQFCRKCGARLLDDSNFCSFCGTAIVEDSRNVLP